MNTLQNEISKAISNMKLKSPLVHNITNYVVMQITANALLAVGASPVMTFEKEEFEDMLSIASSLVINIGTLTKNSIEAMYSACEIANKKNVPFVIDPVGAGATKLRTKTAIDLIKNYNPKVVRGNASEIMVLSGESVNTKGVDSTANVNMALEAGKHLGKEYNTVVSISGETDIITDGDRVLYISGGSNLMPINTGMGCTSTAITGAMIAVSEPLIAAASAMCIMASAGESAAKKAQGPASFSIAFIDELYKLDINDASNRVKE
ncbi:hydroxyethylthiazole kinase [Brachyspira sp.]|uniref:hydroxyethylthiazole kinase n=1 Tax=Brachyspira sp. TaxID=1977261 RepID=UPI0026218349|nr:hydroxyethylthiazole kinase [Brachyspira sp.]